MQSYVAFTQAACETGLLSRDDLAQASESLSALMVQTIAPLCRDGQAVSLTGLSVEHLNGSVGVVCGGLHAGDRLPVQIIAQGESKRMLVRLRNLRPTNLPARVPAAHALVARLKEEPGVVISPALAFVKDGANVSVVATRPIPAWSRPLTIPWAMCLGAHSEDMRAQRLGTELTMAHALDEVAVALAEIASSPAVPLAPAEVLLALVVMHSRATDLQLSAVTGCATQTGAPNTGSDVVREGEGAEAGGDEAGGPSCK